jgi:hypothetical protein
MRALWRFNLLLVLNRSLLNEEYYLINVLKLKLIYNRRPVGKSVLVSGSHLEPMTRILFSVWRLRVSGCEVPSLKRGWICNLLIQLLLGLAKAVTFESESRILLSHLRLSQPGGPGPHIYIPQEQGCPIIPSSNGFRSCRHLRLAGLWWRYSNSPPHGINVLCNLSPSVKVILWPMITQPVCLGVRHPSGTRDQFFPFSF